MLAGCASSRMSDRTTDRLFREGKYDQAVERLKDGLEKEGDGNDQLLWLMDLGLALHAAGRYDESTKYFLQADKIAEIKDYTSLAAEATTLLTSENIKHYQGEDFEKVMINVYLAMNYAIQGNTEEALVEARRVNRKLYLMITDGQRKYKLNEFARYLSAILYESNGDYNDAYIDYKETLKLRPTFKTVGRDLWRTAWLQRMNDEADGWRRQFGLSSTDIELAKETGPRSAKGEVVILYENGISPIKQPNPQFTSLPKFFARRNPSHGASILVNDQMIPQGTEILHDIEATAIQNLDEKYGALVAKKIAGVVAKEVVANQVEKRTDSPILGALTRLFFYASDTADVRSWSLLPKDLQVARVTLPPGEYRIQVQPQGVGERLPEKTVKVVAGRKTFVAFRYTPSF